MSSFESDFTKILKVNQREEKDCPVLVRIGNYSKAIYQHNEMDKEESSTSDSADYVECTDSDSWSIAEEEIGAKYRHLSDFDDKCYKQAKVEAHILNVIGQIDKSIEQIDTNKKVENEQVDGYNTMSYEHIKSAVIITANVTGTAEKISRFTIENDSSNTGEILSAIEKSIPSLEVCQKENMGTRLFKSFNSPYVLALLKTPIYFYGALRFKLISGEMEVYGFNAHLNKEYELFSIRGCSSICLNPITSKQKLDSKLEELLLQHNLHFDAETLNHIKVTYNSRFHAIVLLRRNEERERMILHYKRYMNENIFPNLEMLQAKTPLQECEQLLNCHINTHSMQALQMPNAWQKLFLTESSRLILVGGKAVGKSTLLRVLLNRYLSSNKLEHETRVLLIDLDVGQPELSAPQMISYTLMDRPLLGPGCFLNKPTDFSYFVGEINVTLCTQRYLHAVKLLVDKCQATESYKNIPWLINSMGYNQGIGTELIAAFCELIQPTDVVQIQSNVMINNFPNLLEPNLLRSMLHELDECGTLERQIQLNPYVVPDYRLHILTAAVSRESRYQREWYMSAKDLRYASLLAQMSDVLMDEGIYLIDSSPWCAAFANIKVISLSDPQMCLPELRQALTANVVYLCYQATENETPMECFGIGIVRSVNEENIYIMPGTKHNMSRVNCVVLSEQPIPTASLKCQGLRVKNTFLPFLYLSDGHASTTIKQIYRRPIQFLSGKHRPLIA